MIKTSMANMKIDNSDKSIISITKDTLEEAIEVLARAFEDDPIINYFLSGHTDDHQEMLREIFRYQCLMYIEMGLPIFGTSQNSRITGISCLSVPEKKDRPDSLIETDKEFEISMGPDSFGRVKHYMILNKKHTPEGPHHYLAALGVHPDFQGQGFARLLMERVNEISENHDTSKGVYLETAKLKNVEMYKHFGYNLLATEKLDGIVDLWYMFRPDKKND
ncbi:GNAT family N-acetyltransferase [Chloroflexota bacterium]